jgi:hypothetical protein
MDVTGKSVSFVTDSLFGSGRRFSIAYGSTRTIDKSAVILAGWLDTSAAVIIYKGRGRFKAWAMWKPPVDVSWERRSSATSVSAAKKFLLSVGVPVPASVVDVTEGALLVKIKTTYSTYEYYVKRVKKSMRVYSRYGDDHEAKMVKLKSFADYYFNKEMEVIKPLPADMVKELESFHMLANV